MPTPRVTIGVLSHRPALARAALTSAWAQTVRCQVLLQDAAENWNTKVNEIFSAAKGEWIIPLCDDDQLDPQYVERCLAAAEHADIVYTDRRFFQVGEAPATAPFFRIHGEEFPIGGVYGVTMVPSVFMFGSSLPMTVMIRKRLWDRLGGYDARMPHADTEFWYRACVAGARFVYVALPLFWYHQHPGQLSRVHDSQTAALRVFHRKHFEAFGVRFEDAHVTGPKQLRVEIMAPALRAGYAAAHFTSLTTHGYMATDTKVLSAPLKRAIRLTIDGAQAAVNEAIAEVLDDQGLSPADGWKIDTATLNAVRETPDAAPQGLVPAPAALGESPPVGPMLVTDVDPEAQTA